MLSVKYSNAAAAAILTLKRSGIDVDPALIDEELDKHPDDTTLRGISDVLDSFKIENSAYKVPYGDLGLLQTPFIAHTTTGNGSFVVVNKVKKRHVYVSSEIRKNRRIAKEDFKKDFTGFALTVDKVGNVMQLSRLRAAISAVAGYRLSAGLLFVFLVLMIWHSRYLNVAGLNIILITLIKSAGLMTTVLLLIQSIDSNNPLVQRICKAGTKTGCGAMLSSNAAKVFSWLSWSEVGFYYFGATWLMLFFSNLTLVPVTLLVFNLLSLPYTFYSFYYQAHVAKQWCVLCCTVQALLWLEFFSLMPVFFKTGLPIAFHHLILAVTLRDAADMAICLLIPLILWSVAKPYLKQRQQLVTLKQQLHGFKYNTRFFNNALTAQPHYGNPGEDWSIVLGNEDPAHVITMVSNVYCKPCNQAHEHLYNLLAKNSNLQARIIFNIADGDSPSKITASRHLLSLSRLPDRAVIVDALHQWHTQGQKNYKTWAEKYPVELMDNAHDIFEQQRRWCKMAEVDGTPALFIDGYRLPQQYTLADLTYMLD